MKDTRLKLRRQPRIWHATYGATNYGPPCLWGTLKDALVNREADERVYRVTVTPVREIATPAEAQPK